MYALCTLEVRKLVINLTVAHTKRLSAKHLTRFLKLNLIIIPIGPQNFRGVLERLNKKFVSEGSRVVYRTRRCALWFGVSHPISEGNVKSEVRHDCTRITLVTFGGHCKFPNLLCTFHKRLR